MACWQRLSFALGSALIVACGGTGSAVRSDGGAPESGADGGLVDSIAESAPRSYVGSFIALQYNGYDVAGSVVASQDAPTCQLGVPSGSCCYVSGSSTGGPHEYFAGSVAVKDGTTTLALMTEDPGGGYHVASTATPALTWSSGDTLGLSAAGDPSGVAAFMLGAAAPAAISGESPTIGGPYGTSVGRPFTIAWPSVGAGDKVTLHLFNFDQPGDLFCTTDDATGTLTVDYSLMKYFPIGMTGTIDLFRESVATVAAQNTTVTLWVATALHSNALFQ